MTTEALRVTLLAGSAGLALGMAATAHAEDDAPGGLAIAAAAAAEADSGDEAAPIVVTGVRGARARTVADSPVPIDVISGAELRWDPLESTCRHASLSIL